MILSFGSIRIGDIRLVFLVLVSFLLVQCSNSVDFDDKKESAISSEKVADGEELEPIPDDEIPEEGEVEDDPVAQVPKFRRLCRPLDDELNVNSNEVINISGSRRYRLIQQADQVSIENFRGRLKIKGANELVGIENFRGALLGRASFVGDIQNVRGFSALSTFSMENSKVSDTDGFQCIGSNALDEVQGHRGILVLIGPQSGGTVRKIANVRGPVVLINMNVQEIDEVRGPIILLESSAQSITNHNGRVISR